MTPRIINIDAIVIRCSDTGKSLAVIKNVGPEEAWGTIDVELDGEVFDDPVPMWETPEEFVSDPRGLKAVKGRPG